MIRKYFNPLAVKEPIGRVRFLIRTVLSPVVFFLFLMLLLSIGQVLYGADKITEELAIYVVTSATAVFMLYIIINNVTSVLSRAKSFFANEKVTWKEASLIAICIIPYGYLFVFLFLIFAPNNEMKIVSDATKKESASEQGFDENSLVAASSSDVTTDHTNKDASSSADGSDDDNSLVAVSSSNVTTNHTNKDASSSADVSAGVSADGSAS